jgi:hypothetical protein
MLGGTRTRKVQSRRAVLVLVSTSGAEIYDAMCADLAGKRPPAREPASYWSKGRRKHVLPSPSFFPSLRPPIEPGGFFLSLSFIFSVNILLMHISRLRAQRHFSRGVPAACVSSSPPFPSSLSAFTELKWEGAH